MKKQKLNNDGAVLFTVICLMSILTVVLMTAIIVVSSSHKKAITNYTDSQVYITAKSTLDTFIDGVGDTSTTDFNGIRDDIQDLIDGNITTLSYNVTSPLGTNDKIQVEKSTATMTIVTATAYLNGNEASVSREMTFVAGSSANTTDIVFVFDVSNSMSNADDPLTGFCDRHRAWDAAKNFANQCLDKNTGGTPLVKIGMVKFGTGSLEIVSMTDNKSDYESYTFDTILTTPSYNWGGTNIQAGIRKAENMLYSSAATNKFIIILGDGKPTYSYKVNNWKISDGGFYTFGVRLGYGGGFKLLSRDSLGNWHNDKYSVREKDGSMYNVIDNKYGTVKQAENARSEGCKIFTIGFGLDETDVYAIETLKEVADSPAYFYKANKTDDTLSSVLGEIGVEIENSATGLKYVNK